MAARAGWMGSGAAAILALAPGEARAADYEIPAGPHVSFELGLAWHDGIKLTLGSTLRSGGLYGPLARVELLGLSSARLTLAGQASMYAGGELGAAGLLTWGAPSPFAVGLHAAGGLDLGIGGAWLRAWVPFMRPADDWFLSLALEASPTREHRYVGPIDGRPLRAGGAFLQPPVLSLSAPDEPLRKEEHALQASASLSAAAEAASIPSFLRLAAELEAAGASLDLVRRARGAAREEVRHAQMALSQAERWGKTGHAVPLIEAQARTSPTRREALSRLAYESWVDGCLNEGVAAAQVAASARLAREPETQRTQRRIARDEAGHAELAWDVLEWAMREGPAAVRDRVAAAINERPEPQGTDDESLDVEWLERHGMVSSRTKALVANEQTDRARKRLKRLLERVS